MRKLARAGSPMVFFKLIDYTTKYQGRHGAATVEIMGIKLLGFYVGCNVSALRLILEFCHCAIHIFILISNIKPLKNMQKNINKWVFALIFQF